MPRGEIANILGTLCRGSDGVNARADAAEQFVINWNEQRMELARMENAVLRYHRV